MQMNEEKYSVSVSNVLNHGVLSWFAFDETPEAL